MQLRSIRGGLVAAILVLASAFAHGQPFRTYLSLDGSDANPCTLPSPCRLLPAALAVVASGGEVWMLDSANYNTGPVNVSKSVTILAVPGALGSVVALGGSAFSIATAGVRVTLRNLNILPFPGNDNFNGIEMSAGASIVVQDCSVSGFANGAALWVTNAAQVSILDSGFRGNAYGTIVSGGATARVTGSHFVGGGIGFYVAGAPGTTSAAVSRSIAANNSNVGFAAESQVIGSGARLSVVDSVVEQNGQAGVAAYSIAGATSLVAVSNSLVVRNNGNGLRASGTGGATLVVRGNTVTHNDSGLVQLGSGVVLSTGGNMVRGNSFETTGTITSVGPS